MQRRVLFAAIVLCVYLSLVLVFSGCTAGETEEQVVIEAEGVLVGQIDSRSVEIEINGQPRAYIFGEGVNVAGIEDGSTVVFTYRVEADRPVILAIEATGMAAEPRVLEGQGIYHGRIDSHSVEIEHDGQIKAFVLDHQAMADDLTDGSKVFFTYLPGEHRPLLLSIEIIEAPAAGEDDLSCEGVLQGQVDARSVEILLERTFFLDEAVDIDQLEEGDLVVFEYTGVGRDVRLVLIEAVEEQVEGDVLHGTLLKIDGEGLVVIRYHQVFAYEPGIDFETIADGSEVIFSYRRDLDRPTLTSIREK